MGYKVKTDFWGHKSYYDSKGNLIGKEETTWLGDKVIKDRNGNKVARPELDEYGRETIVMESKSSFFSPSRTTTILRDGELEDWEMCDNCGEYLDGDDDMYCEDCLVCYNLRIPEVIVRNSP